MPSEQELINIVKNANPKYIGDDAALINFKNHHNILISHDQLIENIHFRTKYFTAEDLAHKALHANISDIAAMGGKPLYILCGLGVPKHLYEYAKKFLQSLTVLCSSLNIEIIGGDTTGSTHDLIIGISIIGHATNPVKRSSANNSDLIACIGNLGWAHLGLLSLEQHVSVDNQFIRACLRPNAKFDEGRWLAKNGVTAMMDLSDGLLIDLEKLCHASKCGAEITLDNMHHTKEFIQQCNTLALNPDEIACIGGEDYGLLFTVSANMLANLKTKFFKQFNYPIKILGKITNNANINYTINNMPVAFKAHPFKHM